MVLKFECDLMRITWKACSNTECGVHPRDAFNKLADDTDAAGLEVILRQLPNLWNRFSILVTHWTSLVVETVKASAYNAGDLGSIPGSGRSPGGGNGNPLQYSRQENPIDIGAWWTTFHRVAKDRT